MVYMYTHAHHDARGKWCMPLNFFSQHPRRPVVYKGMKRKAPYAMGRIRTERGLISRIAEALGITRGAVSKWTRVPAERVLVVEGVTGIPRHKLRPDIYPPRSRRRG
jgi:hypothetical protein